MKQIDLLKRRIDAATGRIPCDWILKDGKVLNSITGDWETLDLGIIDGVLTSFGRGFQGKRVLDLKDRWVVPGFIDAHVHVESSLLLPHQFQKAVLPKGTTTAICDPHEIANVQGVRGIETFLKAAETLHLDLKVMLSSCVPATHMETNGGGHLRAQDLVPLLKYSKAWGLAEMMNVPGVLTGDRDSMEKIEAFSNRPIDGHCPLLQGNELNAYAATGISSCHESSELSEAQEKLKRGLSIWIREGSVAKDLEALAPLLTLWNSPFIGFCTDDRNPLDIAEEGHIDHLIRKSIQLGLSAPLVYRTASWSVARHYGLDQGPNRKGLIAPGYAADLVILEDVNSCAIKDVFKSGQLVSEINFTRIPESSFENSIRAQAPGASELEGPVGSIHCIDVLPGKIITHRSVRSSKDPAVARLSVLERYGNGSSPANGYVSGFGASLAGAIGSSVGHDSHNLCVVGKDTRDMEVAMKWLIQTGGGFVVVKNQQVIAQLALPVAGLMSPLSHHEIAESLKGLRAASREIQCELSEPFLQLAFLCLPVIPALKMTDKGLVDVEEFKIISVRA